MVAKQFCISMLEKRIIIQIAAGNALFVEVGSCKAAGNAETV